MRATGAGSPGNCRLRAQVHSVITCPFARRAAGSNASIIVTSVSPGRTDTADARSSLVVSGATRRGAALEPALVPQDPPEYELDLPVQAPQLIVGPRLQRVEDRVEDAAAIMVRDIERQKRESHFPFVFSWILKFLRILPFPVYQWLILRGTRGQQRARRPITGDL